jgi:hypothetical protein
MKVVSTISGKTLIGDPMGPSTACLFAATLRPQDSDTQQIYWIDAHSGLARRDGPRHTHLLREGTVAFPFS